MRRIIAIAFVLACVVAVGVWYQRQAIFGWQSELVLTEAEAQVLQRKLQIQTRIQDIEKELVVLRARYAAIPEGSAYHRPWASLTDIKAGLRKAEENPTFAKTEKCTFFTEDTETFCRDYHRLRSDQYRWYALTKLAVRIRALEHELIVANIQAIQADDPIRSELSHKLMSYGRQA